MLQYLEPFNCVQTILIFVNKEINSDSFKNNRLIGLVGRVFAIGLGDNGWYALKPNQTKPNPLYLIYIYKEDLVLNNLQWLICHKTKPNQILYI